MSWADFSREEAVGSSQAASIHPLARGTMALALTSAWVVEDSGKIVIVAALTTVAFLVVPCNAWIRALSWMVSLMLAGNFLIASDLFFSEQATLPLPLIVLLAKFFFLAASAVVAFSGLGLAGAVHAANMIWRPLAVLVGAALCGTERIMRSFQELRDVQRTRGLRFRDSPPMWISVLMFNWISYIVELSGGIEAQLATKWYGGGDFRVPACRAFGRARDWWLLGLGIAVVVVELS